jgi:hypothetical protein
MAVSFENSFQNNPSCNAYILSSPHFYFLPFVQTVAPPVASSFTCQRVWRMVYQCGAAWRVSHAGRFADSGNGFLLYFLCLGVDPYDCCCDTPKKKSKISNQGNGTPEKLNDFNNWRMD